MDESDDFIQYNLNKVVGENNDSMDLRESLNSFLFDEWASKIEKINKSIYNSQVKITQEDVVQCFHIFYTAFGDADADLVKKIIKQLTIFAQIIILDEFENFFKCNIPAMLVELFSIDDVEIHYLLISFMRELGSSPKQRLFEPIIKCSFFENIIHSASQNMLDENYIQNIIEFFEASYENFKCTRVEILRNESLNLLKSVISNSNFTEELRKLPIKILSGLYQLQDTTSIQKEQISDFLITFFEIKSNKNQKILNSILEFFKTMIKNNDTDGLNIINIQNICLNLMMENKNVAILTNSILILNLTFNYDSESIPIISEEIQFKRLIKLSKDQHNSLSRASLLIINSIMQIDPSFFNYFLSNDIVPIVLSKLDNDFKLETKYAAASILSLIVMNGTIEQQLSSAQSGFIHYLLEIISIDIEKFVFTAIPPLMTLLEKSTIDPQFSFVWELFDEEEGFQIISELKQSVKEEIQKNADSIIDCICRMRDSLNQ